LFGNILLIEKSVNNLNINTTLFIDDVFTIVIKNKIIMPEMKLFRTKTATSTDNGAKFNH